MRVAGGFELASFSLPWPSNVKIIDDRSILMHWFATLLRPSKFESVAGVATRWSRVKKWPVLLLAIMLDWKLHGKFAGHWPECALKSKVNEQGNHTSSEEVFQ